MTKTITALALAALLALGQQVEGRPAHQVEAAQRAAVEMTRS